VAAKHRRVLRAERTPKGRAYSRAFLLVQWAITALASLIVGIALLLGGSATSTGWAASVSRGALLVSVFPIGCAAAALYCLGCLLLRTDRQDPISAALAASATRRRRLSQLGWAGLVVGLLGLSVPSYAFEHLAGFHARGLPLAALLALLSLQALLVARFSNRLELLDAAAGFVRSRHNILRDAAWVFAGSIVVWILVALTGMGIAGHEDYWYEAGVPVLPGQIGLAVLAGCGFSRVEARLRNAVGARLDVVVFAAAWIFAAILWATAPVTESYFNPRPRSPNHEMYPYSDAATYDLQSQSALLGYGLDYGRAVDNPLYPTFLALVHVFAGQDYAASMAFQAATLAVFPAVVYLLGSNLLGRTAGVAASTLVALRGLNSIDGAAFLNLAGPKQMLTDFPAALGVALVLLTILPRRESAAREPALAIWHGAAVGFAFLIRSTALVLLALAPLAILLRRPPFAKGVSFVLTSWLGFVLFVAPWGVRNSTRTSNSAIQVYLSKAEQVWTTRLGFDRRSPPAPAPDAPDDAAHETKQPHQADAAGGSKATGQNETIAAGIAGHFFHNVIGSVLILPTSAVLNDLWHTVKAADTVWLPRWSGELGGWRRVGLLVALALLALGIAWVSNRRGRTGLLPLFALVLYVAANSIGGTSGGRYLVPADWIVLLYFVAGILALLGNLSGPAPALEDEAPPSGAPGARAWITAVLVVTALGATPLLVESPLLVPSAAADAQAEVLDTPATVEALRQAGYGAEEIARFLHDNKATAIKGQVMYPKFLGYRALANQAEGAMAPVAFPHLEFVLMGPEKPDLVALYGQTAQLLPHLTDAVVIGCRRRTPTYVDAIVVAQVAEAGVVHLRENRPPLACPLPEPACDNNGRCQ
jgi:hypothetical protein